MNIRGVAAKVLAQVLQQQQSLAELLPYPDAKLSPQDDGLLQELCFGVCRWHFRLSAIADALLDRPLKGKDSDIQALLELGFYQLLFMRIPAHAAVSETVGATKTLGKPWARGLVNAILRRFQREQESLLSKLENNADYQYAHPKWLLTRLRQAWPEQWQSICHANNARAPMTLRVNQQRTDRATYLERLNTAGIQAKPGQWAGQGIQLETPCAVTHLPDFEKGAVSVQDEAAQLAVSLLDLSPGLRVLDACAAPGGKTCHILEQEPQLSEVVALELDNKRMARVKDNLARLHLTATLIEGDATMPDSWWNEQAFDRILLDAPCSATGVIRRHPDIKLLRRNADIDKLASQQLGMLQALWPTLKSGGLLVYATCSVLPDENEQVLADFLANTADAMHQPIACEWGVACAVGRHLLPQENSHDGFYYAMIRKQKN